MKKVLRTLELLFWGNLAFIVIAFYTAILLTVGTTIAFYSSLMEIWFDD